MPPKKAETEDSDANAIKGFTARETKLLAAAFVASVGPDKASSLTYVGAAATDPISMTTTSWPPSPGTRPVLSRR